MRVNEVADGRLELGDTAVRAAAQLFGRELGKPALNQIQPRAVRRGEVHIEARSQPAAA
jgi:hypothetical protein